MMRLRTIAVLPFLLLCALVRQAPAQAPAGEWRLVFAVDSSGQRTDGDKERLLRAVRAGHPVRVAWHVVWRAADGTSGVLEHVAAAQFLTVHHGEVFAQIAPILGQRPSAREPSIAFRTDSNQLWYGLLDTTGRLTGHFAGSSAAQTTRVPTFWYVEGV